MHTSSTLALSLALFSTTAFAADLPTQRVIPTASVPLFTWTGLYVGGQIGYEFGKSNATLSSAVTGAGIASSSGSPNGVVGGAHIGYLYELHGVPVFGGLGTRTVVGVEADLDGTTARTDYILGPVNNYSNQPIQGSLRGRLGFGLNRSLIYATGGVAFDYIRTNYRGPTGDNQINTGRVGYTVGGGVEYAFTDTLSTRLEYRYTDFGSFTQFPTPTVAFNANRRETDNRVQVGFSYRIEPPTPVAVVARY